MSVKPITISNFKGWLNLSTTSDIDDNQFQVASNMFYNQKGQIQTRYGIKAFSAATGSNKPITSYFFFQRDDTWATMALCASGTDIYKYTESTDTRASIKSGLTEFETATGKTTWRTRRDFAVYKNIVHLTNWVDPFAAYNGTTYTEYAGQKKYRYINMTTDRLFGSWEDTNPSTVYFSDAAPADCTTMETNAVVVGWDELGRINGMNELGNIILVLKSWKIYSVDVTNEKAEAIDAQTGWYSDRTIANVGNSLVYLTDRWVDTLQPRQWVSGASALESKPLDENVRELTTKIEELNLNANCGWYIKRLGNYYITFDTNWDDVPDTTLVYNAMTKGRTQYTYPTIYDYGMYINSDWEYQYVITSATGDAIYEMEVGFDDLWELIQHELKSKDFDFWEPWSYKTYEYIDIIGEKSKGYDIELNIEVDWVGAGWGLITDDMIIQSKPKETLWVRPIWVDWLTGSTSDEWIDMYQYVARIPLFATGSKINFQLKSTWGSRTLDKARIAVNGESVDVFGFANII